MWSSRDSPTVLTEASQRTIQVEDHFPVWLVVLNPSWRVGEGQV